MLNRRSFIGSLLAMPAVIRSSGLLMPIKRVLIEPMQPILLRDYDVTMIVYQDSIIYQQNSLGHWYRYVATSYQHGRNITEWLPLAGAPRMQLA